MTQRRSTIVTRDEGVESMSVLPIMEMMDSGMEDPATPTNVTGARIRHW